MSTGHRARRLPLPRHRRARIALLGAIVASSLAALSAHVVKGVAFPSLATAFVSSPSATLDAPVKIGWGAVDTGLRVACFYVANTSPPRLDEPGWPRITTVGFELPGAPVGFTLMEPREGWDLVEGRRAAVPGHEAVTLDLALVARAEREERFRKEPGDLPGIPPGQAGTRGSGTRFCVSGPFPDSLPSTTDPEVLIPTTIEQLINGVIVRFHRIQRYGPSIDVGVWDNAARTIPLYRE